MVCFDTYNEKLLLQAILKICENDEFSYELKSERHDFSNIYILRVMGHGREFCIRAEASLTSFTVDCGETRKIIGTDEVGNSAATLSKFILETVQKQFNVVKEAMAIFLGEQNSL